QDRNAAGWARQDLAVRRGVVLTLEINLSFTNERNDDLASFLEAADAMVKRDAEGSEFRLVPASAETERDPSAADFIERCRQLRGDRGVAERGAEDQRAKLDSAGSLGQRGPDDRCLPDAGSGLAWPPIQEMVVEPDRIKSRLLGAMSKGADLSIAEGAVERLLMSNRQDDADAHVSSSRQ